MIFKPFVYKYIGWFFILLASACTVEITRYGANSPISAISVLRIKEPKAPSSSSKFRTMDTLLFSPSSSAYPALKPHALLLRNGFSGTRSAFYDLPSVRSSFRTLKLPTGFARKSTVLASKKTNAKTDKDDSHRSVPKPDESTGFFPEAVLLKEVEFYATQSSYLFFLIFISMHLSSYVRYL